MHCANCGQTFEATGYLTNKDRTLTWCPACSGYADALNIGNPFATDVLLYDNNDGRATSWTGPVMGRIVRKTNPDRDYHGRARFLAACGMEG